MIFALVLEIKIDGKMTVNLKKYAKMIEIIFCQNDG